MLRYRADLKTIATLCTYAALCTVQWVARPPLPVAIVLCALTAIVSWLCAVAAHNVVHSPVFTKRWMNRAFQIWVSLSYGFPISDYVPGHNLSHHRYTQRAEDVMRTTKVRFRWNLLNLLFFFPAVTPSILRGNALYKIVMGDKARVWRQQLLLEAVVVWSVKVGLTLLDWKLALLTVWAPHLFANFGIVTINFLQHDGCDENHPQNHSRNFTGAVLNFFAFNNGYHGIHHDEPGLHWSLLPQAHAERVKPGLHPNLEQPSLPAYLFKTFIYPGKRVTFEGTPYAPPKTPDADWVQASDSDGARDAVAA